MNYKQTLEESYQVQLKRECPSENRIAYLGSTIFEFTTYDDEMDETLAKGMIEVCQVILDKETFEYIKDKQQYMKYIIMVNMPFLAEKIDWGGSVRGAWFDDFQEYKVDCGNIEVKKGDVTTFIREMLEWVKNDEG